MMQIVFLFKTIATGNPLLSTQIFRQLLHQPEVMFPLFVRNRKLSLQKRFDFPYN